VEHELHLNGSSAIAIAVFTTNLDVASGCGGVSTTAFIVSTAITGFLGDLLI